MLAIFDIDGTVCDTQEVEGRCYAHAVEEIFEVPLETTDWTEFEEPTSSGIVRSLFGHRQNFDSLEAEFRDRFVQLLKQEEPHFPEDFSPIRGATEFFSQLSEDSSIDVAFATGGFHSEAVFKLDCCGIDLGNYPHATSSDTPRRRDIIPLAIDRTGDTFESIVYFGDAPWDVSACRHLNIPMIGIGRRIDHLQSLGLADVFRDFSDPDRIRRSMHDLGSTLSETG